MRKREESISKKADPVEIAVSVLPQLHERERELDRSGQYGSSNIDLLREAGLLGLNVPASAEGLGADLDETVETLRQLAQASPSTALMLAMHTSTLAHYLLDPAIIPSRQRDAFREQRSWAWREAVKGNIFGVANSEPGAGGDVHNSKAQLNDQGTAVSGVKSFASMGTAPMYYMVAARGRDENVQYYLVRNDKERVRVESPWDATGMRSSESVTLRFEEAPVVGALGYSGLLDGVNNRHWSTLSFTAIFVGIAESLLEDAVRQAEAMLQKTECVELQLTLQACRGFLRHAVENEPAVPDAAYKILVRDCKLYVTRALAQRASALFAAQGGGAYRFSSPFSRKLRDLLAGPLLRPPVGTSFDEVWEDLAKSFPSTTK